MRGYRRLLFVMLFAFHLDAFGLTVGPMKTSPHVSSSSRLRIPVAEGFFSETNQFTSGMQQIWDNTYMIAFSNSRSVSSLGTAFLVEAHPLAQGQTLLLFATNKHVLNSYCLMTGICIDGKIYHDAAMAKRPNDSFSWIQADGPNHYSLDFTVVYADKYVDFALIAALVPAAAQLRIPRIYRAPLSAPETMINKTVFHFGYPGIPQEGLSALNKQRAFLVRKRWSSGFLLDTRKKPSNVIGIVATTADGYPGDSGGPIVGDNGIVGLNWAIFNDSRTWEYLDSWFAADSWYAWYFKNSAGISNRFRKMLGLLPGRTLPYTGREGSNPDKFEPHFYGVSSSFIKAALDRLEIDTTK